MIKKSVNSQLDALNRNIQYLTIESIAEELECKKLNDSINEIKEFMQAKSYSIIGIEDNENKKIGYLDYNNCNTDNTEKCYVKFDVDHIISKDSSLKDSIKQINEKNFMFVLGKLGIEKIVTIADLGKPPVSMMYFGIIISFEISLSNWINDKYDKNEWLSWLSDGRKKKTQDNFSNLKEKKHETNMISCTQLCDKLDIYCKCDCRDNDISLKLENIRYNLIKIRDNICHADIPTSGGIDWSNVCSIMNEITNISNMLTNI